MLMLAVRESIMLGNACHRREWSRYKSPYAMALSNCLSTPAVSSGNRHGSRAREWLHSQALMRQRPA